LVIPVSGALILFHGISELIKSIQTIVTGVDHRRKQDAPREIT
jgi:TRAP-type mannitol/chloroaromatic compound transport system permease small subunit